MQYITDGKTHVAYHSTPNDDVMDRMSSSTKEWRQGHRSAMVHLLGGVYGLTVVILGLVFGLAAALTLGYRSNNGQDSFYLEVFQIFLYTISLLFLAYLHTYLLRNPSLQAITASDKLDVEEKSTEKINLEELDSGEKTDCTETLSKSVTPIQLNTQSLPRTLSHQTRPRVTFDARDVNFYLRLGTILFGTGSMVQDGFRFAQLLQDGGLSFRCLSPLDISVVGLHVFFTFFQTFYLFKSHKIVVHQQKGFVRFGFIHLMATNVCVWTLTTVEEIHADVIVTLSSRRPNDTAAACIPESNLSWRASPYLYPSTIQYSIISVAILFQMHRNIFTSSSHPAAHAHCTDPESRAAQQRPTDDTTSARDVTNDDVILRSPPAGGGGSTGGGAVDCDKAHKGLFLGLLIVVLTLVAVSCYFVFGSGTAFFYSERDATFYAGFVFFFTEMALLVLSACAVIVGFVRFRRLRFIPIPGDRLETALLIFALAGVIAMKCFHGVSAVDAVHDRGDVVGVLSVSVSAVLLTEVLLQTVYIVDALRRCVQSPVQQQRKPGRALVTFLLLCNVALVVVAVFEVKKTENAQIHAAFYGQLAWSVISHVTVPVHIYFRFHSVVCLSEIWNNAYKVFGEF